MLQEKFFKYKNIKQCTFFNIFFEIGRKYRGLKMLLSPFSKSTQNKTGQDGFIASIECRFGMMGGSYAAVPFQSCAMYGEIVVISGNSRQSYSKYQIPETIYLPQYFQMSIDNASDKFTTIIKIIDKKTGNVVSVREVGPNSYDMIQN